MEIKKFTIEYLKELSLAFKEVFNSDPWNDNWTDLSSQNRIKEIYDTPGFLGYFMIHKNKIIGAILGNITAGSKSKVYYMYEFFTIEKVRNQGIGQKIYNTLVEELKTQNCEGIFLTTKRDTAAHSFYLKNNLFNLENSVVMFGSI